MASWTKLRSGEWGVRGKGQAPAKGTSLDVQSQAGVVKHVTVACVVWSGDGAWIAAIVAEPRATDSGRRDSYGNRIGDGSSYQAGVTAPHGKCCPQCGSRECSKAWDPRTLCDDD